MNGSRLEAYKKQNVALVGLISEDGIIIKSQDYARTTDTSYCSCLPFCSSGSTGSTDFLDESPYFKSLRHVSGNAIIPYGRIINACLVDGENSTDPFVDSINQTSELQTLGSAPICITITHVTLKNGTLAPETLTVIIDDSVPSSIVDPLKTDYSPISSLNSEQDKSAIVNKILQRSYINAKMERNILVIINPYGGKGTAKQLYMSKCQPILQASRCTVEIAYTKYGGHAIDIAREVDLSKYDTIVCASGDGIPYEVINGLNQRADRAEAFNKLTVTQIPCGSGNAMSVSCHWTSDPALATLCVLKGSEARIDLMACSQQSYANEFPKLSFLSQTYGVIAESDINTEFIRWIGPSRFELGVAFNVFQRKKYPCDIYVKYVAQEKDDVKVHFEKNKERTALVFEETTITTDIDAEQEVASSLQDNVIVPKKLSENDFNLKYPLENGVPDDWIKIDSDLTNNIGIFYTGKMPYIAPATNFFPAALPSDGAIDLVITDGRVSIPRTASILLSLDKGSHVLDEKVIHSKILAYKLVPKVEKGLFSVDGEKFPLEPLQVEVMPQLCKTILRNGSFIDAKFDSK